MKKLICKSLPENIFDQDQTIDFVIEKADANNLTASNDFVYSCNSERDLVVKECIDEIINTVLYNIESEFKQTNYRDSYSNPKVVEAILEFEKGEMLHEVGKCITCYEARPVFNVTMCRPAQLKNGQPEPISREAWKIYNDKEYKN